MGNLIAEDSLTISASDKSFVNTELMMTQQFIRYTLTNYADGYVKRKEMERFIPVKKQDPLYLADSLLNKKHKDNKYFEDINEQYKLLKDALDRYVQIARKGGWPAVTAMAKKYHVGMASPEILSIKKRLQVSGEQPASDSSEVFTHTLENAVKTFQSYTGYKPDGTVTQTLIDEMNIPVQQ